MKKFVLFLTLLLLSIHSNAQYFKLTKDGFVSNDGKDFVIIPVEGKDQSDLFNRVNVFVHSNYVNPDKVLSVIENEMININAEHDKAIVLKAVTGVKIDADINFNMVIKFKDDKIRIDAPNINEIHSGSTYVKFIGNAMDSMNGVMVLFKKNGKIKSEYNVKAIEDFFNAYIQVVLDNINGKDSNDW